MILSRTARSALFALCLGSVAALVIILGLSYRSPRLPYRDSFPIGKMNEWSDYGGTWRFTAGGIQNESAEPGAKLATGSSRWTNYVVDTDIQLLGNIGDAGLIVRSSNEEQGIDSYNGYYVGLRVTDGSLIIGRANHGWEEYEDSRIEGGVSPFHWYHLRVVAYGCVIAGSVINLSTGARAGVALRDTSNSCIPEGRIGLRSNATGGMWRNVQVITAREPDIFAITGKRNIPPSRLALLPLKDILDAIKNRFRSQGASSEMADLPPIEMLAGLKFLSPKQQARPVSIQGIVILTQPDLYIQDSTAGALVSGVDSPPLKIGDVVEVTGIARPGEFSATIQNAAVRLLWAGTPGPPLAITAGEAASGSFDARFVELEGYLDRVEAINGTIILTLHHDDQYFRAIFKGIPPKAEPPKFALASLLRLRGVCVTSTAFTTPDAPFSLLLQAMGDVQRIAGPPWWNTRNLIMIGAILACVLLLGYLLYIRAEHWRLRAVVEERQRLAHELHDTLAQSFAGVGFQLRAIEKTMPDTLPTIREKLKIATRLVEQGHQEARRSISSLRPSLSEVVDVIPALSQAARAMVSDGAVTVHVSSSGDVRTLPLRITDALYRVGVEAIANSLRHAHASRIELWAKFETNRLRLTIEDDGRGFSPANTRSGFGLQGMKARIEQVGGAIQIHSAPGNGARIEVLVSIPRSYRFRFALLGVLRRHHR